MEEAFNAPWNAAAPVVVIVEELLTAPVALSVAVWKLPEDVAFVNVRPVVEAVFVCRFPELVALVNVMPVEDTFVNVPVGAAKFPVEVVNVKSVDEAHVEDVVQKGICAVSPAPDTKPIGFRNIAVMPVPVAAEKLSHVFEVTESTDAGVMVAFVPTCATPT